MKIYTKLVLIIFFFSIRAFGQVTLPHYDSFNYTAGQALYNQAGWDSLNTGDDILITSANLSYPGFAAPSGNKISFDCAGIDAAKGFTQQTTGTVYYSFLLNIKSLGSLNTTGGYLTGFIQTTSSNFGATVWLKKFGSGFTIGINARTTAANTIWSSDTLSINKTYFIIAAYQIVSGTTNDIVKLWLNSSSSNFGGTEPFPTLSATNSLTDLNSLDRILIRQDSNTETPFIDLDELRIGTLWADVTPPVGSSPLLIVDPTGLNNFTYIFGSGPSDLQNYTLSGSNLNGSNVVITAPTNYEISSNGGTSWNNTITISGYGTSINQTISVRLNSGLAIGSYNNEVISNIGGGAATINVICNGNVNAVPADLFFTDYFSYSTGQLTDAPNGTGGNVSDGNWVSSSGTANYVQVSSGGLSYTGYPSSETGNKINIVSPTGSGEDVYRQFTNQVAGSTIYVSFLLNVTNTDGLAPNSTTTGDHFIMLMPINSTTIFVSRVSIRLGTVANTFQIGLRATSSNDDAVWNTNNLSIGTTYLVVFSYQIITGNSNDVAKLWINPSLSGTEPAADLTQVSTLTSDVTSIARLAIRQNLSTSPVFSTPNASIDGIRVAPTWSNAPLPVELSSFSATTIGSTVKLSWRTETELNNYGFEVERASLSASPLRVWEKIGFVNGNGNSNSPKNYNYEDNNVIAGKYSYRLKQIDNDGQFEYSKTIEVELGAPKKFELSQNYPNPFNPVTTIRFNLPDASLNPSQGGTLVKLTVYNILGQQVAVLVNDILESGVHTINFDASDLNSGMYIYKIEAGSFVQTRKMTLVK